MADIKDTVIPKANNKTRRRASIARALHVPASIARHLRHSESAPERSQSPTSSASLGRRREEGKARQPDAALVGPSPPSVTLTRCEVDNSGEEDDDARGAEIPDIPLRRSNTRILGADLGVSSLIALERILAHGDQQGSQPIQPPPPLQFDPPRLRSEKRYDGHQFEGNVLYPVSERSWESSLPDVPDASSPEPKPMRESSSTPNLLRREIKPDFAPRREEEDEEELPLTSGPAVETPGFSANLPLLSSLHQRAVSLTTSATSVTATSIQTDRSWALPPLQARRLDDPDTEDRADHQDDVDSGSFELVIPAPVIPAYSLEHRSELLFSVEHLRVIFSDPIFLGRFTTFVNVYRPHSIPLLHYTLDALKATRAMDWMNGIITRNLRLSVKQPQQQQLLLLLQEHDVALRSTPERTVNDSLRQTTEAALEILARDELPAYTTYVWMVIVEASMKKRIRGTMSADLQEMSEGLAEVYCISDPARADNPIVFASEEFHRTTQYGPDHVLGRNCRFLQGPKTNQSAVQRIGENLKQGREHYETLLNYRRDGRPFMNLLMCTPLLDAKGVVRYFLGAQIDVSGLVKHCSGLESLRRLVDRDEAERKRVCDPESASESPAGRRDEFRLLAELFSYPELDTVRRFGGRMHSSSSFSQEERVLQQQPLEAAGSTCHKPRVVLHDAYDPISPLLSSRHAGSRRELRDTAQCCVTAGMDLTSLIGSHDCPSKGGVDSSATKPHAAVSAAAPATTIFENYLVVRPYPSLRILFASPSLRAAGILQSHLMSRIGGSQRIHDELESAFATGQSVTAKVKWIAGSGLRYTASSGSGGAATTAAVGVGSSESACSVAPTVSSVDTVGLEGRPRWIHCTPLLGADGGVGVWMVVIVNDEDGEVVVSSEKGQVRERSSAQLVGGVGGSGAGSKGPSSGGSSGAGTAAASTRGGGGGGPGGEWGQVVEERSLRDFAAINGLPEDEETRRRARGQSLEREWNGTSRHEGGEGKEERERG